jgi:hypothetical protein
MKHKKPPTKLADVPRHEHDVPAGISGIPSTQDLLSGYLSIERRSTQPVPAAKTRTDNKNAQDD